jgi:hypothetical protein
MTTEPRVSWLLGGVVGIGGFFLAAYGLALPNTSESIYLSTVGMIAVLAVAAAIIGPLSFGRGLAFGVLFMLVPAILIGGGVLLFLPIAHGAFEIALVLTGLAVAGIFSALLAIFLVGR